MNRRALSVVLVSAAIMLASTSSWAVGPYYHQSRAAKITRKLTRGLLNTAFFWCEIPHHINQDARNIDPFTGTITGFGKGVWFGTRRLALGLYDVFTFPVEIPRNYESLVEPEFVFMDDLD